MKKSLIYYYTKCYDLRSRNRLKKEPCIRLIQENSIEFQVPSVYLIYTGIIVYTTLNLAYSKEHMLNMLYNIIVLEPFIFFYIMYDYMTIIYVTTLGLAQVAT